MNWTTDEIRYLEEHQGEGAMAIAEAHGHLRAGSGVPLRHIARSTVALPEVRRGHEEAPLVHHRVVRQLHQGGST